MAVFTRAAVATLVLAMGVSMTSAGYVNECSGYNKCSDCLQHEYCGWCSPAPVQYENGTDGTRCADQRDAPWHCDHLYQTTQCVQGWTCDVEAGQCKLAAPGEGDTKENCEKTCKAVLYQKCNWENATCSNCTAGTPGCQKYDEEGDCSKACAVPQQLYKCNTESHQCEECEHAYCTSNADCPGSYCQISGPGPWTCHGNTCSKKYQCDDQCACDTPTDILGHWRGVQVQAGYSKGEFSFVFETGRHVILEDGQGKILEGTLSCPKDKMFNITWSDNTVWQGMYTAWKQGPETENFAFAFGTKAGQAAPVTVQTAMNGGGYVVFSLSHCLANKVNFCNFTATALQAEESAAVAVARRLRSGSALAIDPCNQFNSSCTDCLNAPSGLCGWCDELVVYADNQTGAHCAGFDSTGKANPSWICKKKYRRESCFDYTCDWDNFSQPICKQLPEGQSGMTREECEKGCSPTEELYKCNNQSFTCDKCDIKWCASDKDCPGSYCQIDTSKPGPYMCHGSSADGCYGHDKCNATCTQPPWVGTWRAVQISQGYTRGEFDFTFFADGSVAIRSPSGEVVEGTVALGDQAAVREGTAINIDITSATYVSSGNSFMKAGATQLSGLFTMASSDKNNNAQYMWLGLSGKLMTSVAGPATYDEAMSTNEYILISCGDDSACDFSPSTVPK